VAIKNWQSRETGNIDEEKQTKNTICLGHHYTQANTNNIYKTWDLLQTTGGKDEPTISFLCVNRSGHHNKGSQNVKTHKSMIYCFSLSLLYLPNPDGDLKSLIFNSLSRLTVEEIMNTKYSLVYKHCIKI